MNELPLPFQRLFVQLQNAGFYIGPAERLRVQHLLASSHAEWRSAEGRQNLKYQLAPLICRHPLEQERFYEIYDDFLEYLKAKVSPPLPRTIWEKVQVWLLWTLVGAILVTAIAAYLYWEHQQEMKRKFSYVVTNKTERLTPGDTVRFVNKTDPKDSEGVAFVWKVFASQGAMATDTLAFMDSSQQTFVYRTPYPSERHSLKFVKLEGYYRKEGFFHKKGDPVGVWPPPSRFEVACTRPIRLSKTDTIRVMGQREARQNIQFFAPKGLKKGWTLRWDFDDGDSSALSNPVHNFKEDDTYSVTLTFADTTQNGFCDTSLIVRIDIGEGIPILAEQPLVGDTPKPFWVYTIWACLFAVLLFWLAVYFFFIKWMERPYEKTKEPELEVPEELRKALKPNDHAPYAIPYRSNNAKLRHSAEQIEVAAMLRRREPGRQSMLNISLSISATIEKAGFPDLRFSSNTRPTQYLFLIDLQNEVSHQAQLFRYLTEMLDEQAVLAEVLFYKNDFDRFWNRYHPEGFSLEHLAMIYGDHRVVVFGDAYQLLAENNEKGYKIKPHLADAFKRWPQRMLITPIPKASWSFMEARLYRLFAVFDAGLSGLMQAAAFADKGMDDDSLPPTFAEWQKVCKGKELDIDTDRLWQTPEQHSDYLKEAIQDKKIYHWLRALVVYPELNWNVTIAIGRNLGIDVRYEHLLLLARIPWLQEGVMKTSLWRAWWHQLPKADEKLAREAVEKELQAVIDDCRDGFANQKAQTRLAVQDFALHPNETKAQAAISFIFQETLPSSLLKEELDLVPVRHLGFELEEGPAGSTVKAFLEKKRIKAWRPFYTLDFWLGNLSGLGSLALFLCIAFMGAESFYVYFHPDYTSQNLYKGLLVEQKIVEVDSAMQLNNTASRIWNLADTSGFTPDTVPNYQDASLKSNYVRTLLKRALDIRPRYELAKTNRARVWYNDGIFFLNEKDNPARAIECFHLSLSNDSLRTLSAEALSLAFFRDRQIDSACYWVSRVMALDSNYVNWLAAKGVCFGCRQVANVSNAVGFRNRELSLQELNEIFKNPNSAVARQTLITAIKPGQMVELIDSSQHFWKVRFEGKIGYIAKSVNGKPTLVSCDSMPVIGFAPLVSGKDSVLLKFALANKITSTDMINGALGRAIQKKLCELGILDPEIGGDIDTPFHPIGTGDGILGLNTRSALQEFCRIAKIEYQDKVFTPEMATKLDEAQPNIFLPLKLEENVFDSLETRLAKRILRALQKAGYWIARSDQMYNIVYVEGMNADGTPNGDFFNHWNDRRLVIRVSENGEPVLMLNDQATTEPGSHYTWHPLNPKGVARIAFGQYKAWVVGLHKGDQPALVQREKVRLLRDLNKDGFRSASDPIDIGKTFGINQHSTHTGTLPEFVDSYSAGPLVGRDYEKHIKFLDVVKNDIRYKSNKGYLFITTIIPVEKLGRN
ncbi:MAG: PKD domain-containing protein [Phycisphaerae bacterium]|nr:PKD domain-containing protein [Saprospiraceae bacterium]